MEKKLQTSITKLINDIKNTGKIDNNLITEIVEANTLSEKDISPFITFNHKNNESYGRKLIFDNGNFKVLLMSWKSGDFTAIHNHGYTEWGSVYFFGEATHRLYDVTDNKLKILQKDNFHEGQIASVCGDLTHLMGNASSKDFATLHIYGSNTRKSNVSEDAKVYLPEFQKLVTTMGSAYLNMNKKLILTEKPLLNMKQDVLSDYFNLVKLYYERNKQFDIIKKMDISLNNYN